MLRREFIGSIVASLGVRFVNVLSKSEKPILVLQLDSPEEMSIEAINIEHLSQPFPGYDVVVIFTGTNVTEVDKSGSFFHWGTMPIPTARLYNDDGEITDRVVWVDLESRLYGCLGEVEGVLTGMIEIYRSASPLRIEWN